MDFKIQFSTRLYNLMLERGMTQAALAEKIGVTDVSMSRYVTGKRIPRSDVLNKIARYFGVSVDYLLNDTKRLDTAQWTVDNHGIWACHSCGLLKAFHGNPYDNDFNYCPKCGKRIVVRGEK